MRLHRPEILHRRPPGRAGLVTRTIVDRSLRCILNVLPAAESAGAKPMGLYTLEFMANLQTITFNLT